MMEGDLTYRAVSEPMFAHKLGKRRQEYLLPADNSPTALHENKPSANNPFFRRHPPLSTTVKPLSGGHQPYFSTNKARAGNRPPLFTATNPFFDNHQQAPAADKPLLDSQQNHHIANNSHSATDNIRHIITAGAAGTRRVLPIGTGRVIRFFIHKPLKIKSMRANWRRLSNRSLGAAIKRVINVTNFNANEEAKNHVLFSALVTLYDTFAPLIPKSVWSGMSESVRKAAAEVYAYLKGIRKIAEGAAQFPDTERGRAGMEIAGIIKKGGKIYDQKTSEADFSTTSVINELNKPENAPHAAALGITQELEKLTEAKERHDALDTQRVDTESELRQTESATNARPGMEAALKNWLGLVTAMRKVDGWQDLYADLNEVVKASKRAIREGKELNENGEVVEE